MYYTCTRIYIYLYIVCMYILFIIYHYAREGYSSSSVCHALI